MKTTLSTHAAATSKETASIQPATNKTKKASKTMTTTKSLKATSKSGAKSAKKTAKNSDAPVNTTNTTVLNSAPAAGATGSNSTIAALTNAALASGSSSGATTTATTVGTVSFVQPPPKDLNIPAVAQGANLPLPGTYRTVLPKAKEAAVLPGAVTDLQRFTDFATEFPFLASEYPQIVQIFETSSQWTMVRTAVDQFAAFAIAQEGLCWEVLRPLMAKLNTAFAYSVENKPGSTLASTYPNLAAFLGAKAVIAKKGAATRKANKAAVAEGKAPSHGAVGKARQKAANKAIVAQVKGASSQATSVAAPAVTAPVVVAGATH